MRNRRRLGWTSFAGAWVVLGALALSIPSPAQAQRSIFDEDPNNSQVPPAAAPAIPAPAAPVERLPVPPTAAQASAERLVRELFRTEYAQRMPHQRLALSRKLLEAAAATRDKPAERFVLLREARDVAEQGGDLELALHAVDVMATEFLVEPIELKLELLRKVGDGDATRVKRVAGIALDLAEAAVMAEKPALIARATTLAEQAARASRDLAFVRATSARTAELRSAQQVSGRYPAAVERLRTAPNDPEANLAVGRYLCFIKDDWAQGLPHLAKGTDPALRSIAERELTAPAGPAVAQIADAWWELSEKQALFGKTAMQRRAGGLYQKALPGLAGLERMVAEKRLAELGAKAASGIYPVGDAEYWKRQVVHAEVRLGRQPDAKIVDITDLVSGILQRDPFAPVHITEEVLVALGHAVPEPQQVYVNISYRMGGRPYSVGMPLNFAAMLAPFPHNGQPTPGASETLNIFAARLGIGTEWRDVTEAAREWFRDPAHAYRLERATFAPNFPPAQRPAIAIWFDYQGRRYHRTATIPGYLRLAPQAQ